MDILSRRADGLCETQNGLIGVYIPRPSGELDNGQVLYFDYRPSVMLPAIRVAWPAEGGLAVIPNENANIILQRGYGFNVTDDQLAAYNEFVEVVNAYEAEHGEAKQADTSTKDEDPGGNGSNDEATGNGTSDNPPATPDPASTDAAGADGAGNAPTTDSDKDGNAADNGETKKGKK